MNSFILISKDQTTKQNYVQDFCLENAIDPLDQSYIQTDTSSIGIELIREMQKHIFFKPIKGQKKIIVIQDAQILTIEAQNALLKILEEPPIYTYIFLLTTSENTFLPTIISRCKIVRLEEEKKHILPEEEGKYLTNFHNLTKGSIAERLALAEKLASDKAQAVVWMEEMMYFLHKKLLENPGKGGGVAEVLEKLQESYKILQTTNVNPRLLLEHTFLTLQT
ncbi:MAG TPA: hypothetical protein VF189_06155 [Patescibacteria group bacterium]